MITLMTALIDAMVRAMQAASAGHWAVLALIVLVLFVIALKLFPSTTHLGVRVLVFLVLCVVLASMWVYAVNANIRPGQYKTFEEWWKQRR